MKYSKEFKEEALKLSDEIGLKKAAQQLGIQYYTLSDWRSKRNAAAKAKKYQMSDEELKQRNLELERENAELRKAMIFSRMHSVFSQKTGRSKDKRTSLIRQRISSQIWCKSDLQISENQRIRLLSLAEKSGQAWCKAASSGQNTRNTIRAS